MSTYDLVIKDGTVVDGTGLPGYRADVGVIGDKIATIGRITDTAEAVIDAEGHVVSPGFIDGHTHMDAQVAWDPLGTCSCWHGVTSVVMGNCGFTLAPARPDERHLVVRNLERAEDISAEAMAQGIDWTWETFDEYLDAVDGFPKGINYGGYVGHSALRTWAMGERAFSEQATEDELDLMRSEIRNAMRAGALGFTTSRTPNHETSDDRPVASRIASWDEVRCLVAELGKMGAGIFEIANENAIGSADLEVREEYCQRLIDLTVTTGVPVTFGVIAFSRRNEAWRSTLDLLDRAHAAGGRMFGQAHAREFGVILSFETKMPFDRLAEWQDVRALPLDEQKRAFSDPVLKAKLVDAANNGDYGRAIGAETRAPDYDWIRVMDSPVPPNRTVAHVAAERGVEPAELMIDLAVESDFEQKYSQAIANKSPEAVLAMMKHPRSVVTFSDSGAHVSQIMDSSIQTHLLSH